MLEAEPKIPDAYKKKSVNEKFARVEQGAKTGERKLEDRVGGLVARGLGLSVLSFSEKAHLPMRKPGGKAENFGHEILKGQKTCSAETCRRPVMACWNPD